MRHAALLLTALATLICTCDLDAQRRGRFRRGFRKPPPSQTTPPTKKKKQKVEHWLAITGADIYLGTGQMIRRGTVLIGDDKILEVGHDIQIPKKAQIIDAKGKVVCPGFVAVKASGIGISRSVSGDAKDSVNPFDPTIKMGLSAGITSYLANFSSGSATPSGKNALIKLAYGDMDGMVALENTVKTMRVPLTPQQMKAFKDLVTKAKEHQKKLEVAKTAGKPAPKPPKGTEDLLAVMDGKARLWVACRADYTTVPIRQALEIARLVGRGVVLDNPVTAWVIPDEIAHTGSMAILNPRLRERPDKAHPDTTGSNLASAAILSEAGVPVSVMPPGGRFGGATLGTGGILGQDLHTLIVDAAYTVRGGLDNRKALRTITLDAARILGAEARVGSIEADKDADLLILDGDPLHYKTFVQTAIVNGKVVYEKDKETFYRHIKR